MALALRNSAKLSAYGRIKDRYNSFFRESRNHKECVARAKSKGKQPSRVCLNNKKNAINHRQEAREIYIKNKDKFSAVEIRQIQSMLAEMDVDRRPTSKGGSPTSSSEPAPTRGAGRLITSQDVLASSSPPVMGTSQPAGLEFIASDAAFTDAGPVDPESSLAVDVTGEPTFEEAEEAPAVNPLLLAGGAVVAAGLVYYFVFRR